MTRSRRLVIHLAAAFLTAAALAACSEAKQEIEAGKREVTLEEVGGPAIEQAAGVKLEGGLNCKAGQSGGNSIGCGGNTSAGNPVTLTGTITQVAGLADSYWIKGEFVATVNGRSIVLPNCLGDCRPGSTSSGRSAG